MADETIGRATVELGADGSKLGPEMAAAVAKANGQLVRANKQMERAHARVTRQIQGHIDRIKATRPTNEMRLLEQAVKKLGGTAKLEAGEIKRLRSEVDRLAAAGAKVPKSLAGLTKKGGGGLLGADLGGLAPSLAGGALAYGAGRFATSSLEAQAAQEAAVNKLNLALANQGRLTAETSQSLQEYARALQQTSTFGDETVIAAQAIFAQFGMNEEQIKRSTQVAVDFAAATGRALPDAANAVGKAFAGQTDILREMGIAIDKSKSSSEQFEEALQKLELRFGGSAQASVATYTGQIQQLTNAWGDAKEGFGRLLGVLTSDGGGSPFAGLIAGVQALEKFFGTTLVIAVSEARAQLLVFQKTLIDLTLKLPKFLGGGSQALKDYSGALQVQIDQLREAGNKAATSAGTTLEFKNAESIATASQGINKVSEEAARAKREAEAFQRQLDQWSGTSAQAELDQLAKVVETLGIKGVADVDALVQKLEQLQSKGATIEKDSLLGRLLAGQDIDIPPLIDPSSLKGLDAAGSKLEDISGLLVKTGLDAQEQFNEIAASAKQAGLSAEEIGAALEGAGASGQQVRVAVEGVTEETIDWRGSLQDISNLITSLPGPLQGIGRILSSITAGISGIFTSLANIGKGSGLTGLLSTITGVGGIATSIIGIGSAIGSALGGLFGGGKSEVSKLRDEYFSQWEDGFVGLQRQLSGTLGAVENQDFVKQIFDAKTVEEFEAAVRRVQGVMDTQTEAQNELNAALEKYGFSNQLAEAKELEDTGAQLFKEWRLLTEGGLIPAGDAIEAMGPNLLDFVNKSREAGQAIPEAMRPMIDQLVASGQLVDENGNAFESAEEAGITFAQTMDEQFATLIDRIDQFISALTGVDPDPINIPINYDVTGSPGLPPGVDIPRGKIPAMASGGLVTRPTLALIGEKGPELVVPQSALTHGGVSALLGATRAGSLDAAGGAAGGVGDSITINIPISENPFQSAEGLEQLRRHTLKTVETETSKHLAALIQAGKA